MKLLAGLLACFLFLLAPAPGMAADVEITTTLSSDEIHEGESFIFTLIVSGPMRGSEAPVLPELEDFALAGTASFSNFSFSNGKTSSTKTYRYTLVPLSVGTFTIPAIPVSVKGKIYRSRAQLVSVKAAGTAGANRQPAPAATPVDDSPVADDRSSGAGNDQVFIRSWLDEKQVYVGQQLVHHFALYRQPTVSFLGTPQYSRPDFTGFWAEPLGDEISGYRKVGGRRYAVTELRQALFPSQPGELEIGAATVHLRLRDRSRFEFFSFDAGPEKMLRTKALSVQVLPLPTTGKPSDFSGTVAAKLRLDLRVDAGPYEVGQPVTVTLTLSGEGNPRTFAEPAFEAGEDFKSYDSELQSESSVDQQRIRVTKRFTRIVVPKRDGELLLPAVDYNWFDPETEQYRSTSTRERRLTVVPSSSDELEPVVFSDFSPERVEMLGQDIHHIQTDPPLAGDGHRFPRSSAFWTFLLLPWPLLLGAWIWQRRRDALRADAAGFRARGARKSAGRRLAAAEAARAAGEIGTFGAELSAALRGYLTDRLALSGGFTDDDARRALDAAGVGDTLLEDTLKLMKDCDHARYTPGAEQAGRMDALLDRARRLFVDLDGETRATRRPRGLLGGILPLLLGLIILSGADLSRAALDQELRMAEGSVLYEAGNFDGAAAVWESLAREGLEDSRLRYNLGNAHFQQGKIGRAILNYRRALRLAPRNEELRDNLDLARSRRADGESAQFGGGFLSARWRGLRDLLSTGEFAVIGLILLWIGTALLLLGILRPNQWRRLRWPLIIIALLLPLASIAAWTAEWQDWSGREAVLLAPVVTVSSGPGDDFVTLFEIHEGAELRIKEERGAWVRVSLGDELEGWIPRGSFETL
jgi:tetratricopeptide (TPR) repeat protein